MNKFVRLHITQGSGKMEGIPSINTPTTGNKFCEMMAKKNTVCKSCYARRNESFRKSLVPAFTKNVDPLTDRNYKPEILNHKIIRFHSYGELISPTHLANFIKIALVNPDTFFALWTKRANYVQDYIRRGGVVPSNINFIYSNPIVNVEMKTPPKGFHKVFNVHDWKTLKTNDVKINCGSKSCLGCMICYSKNDIKVVNEKRK